MENRPKKHQDQVCLLESSRLESGGFQYKAPGGQHDDCVMALAIAWDGLQVQERRFEGVVIEGEDPIEEMDKGKIELRK
jgi:hypothetical protein